MKAAIFKQERKPSFFEKMIESYRYIFFNFVILACLFDVEFRHNDVKENT